MHEDKIKIVKEIRHSLYQIHKSLLDYQANLTSLKLERRLSPYDLWQLSVDDQDFDWLKKISSLIIVIDEELEQGIELDAETFHPMVHEINSLFFSPMDKDIAFYEKVSDVKERDPGLLLNLGVLMKHVISLVQERRPETTLSSQIQI